MKLKVYQNDSIGDECCPACGSEFPAPFSLTACSNCGFISLAMSTQNVFTHTRSKNEYR